MAGRKIVQARQNKEVKKKISRWDFDGPLDKAIAILQREREAIPEAYRASAHFEIETDVDYGSATADVIISYYAPETDEEMAARLERVKAEAKRIEDQQRAEYERLKKQFEGT